jgi:hypothetical protein
MESILGALKETPIPTILVVAGIVFLLLSIAGQLAGRITVPPEQRRQATIIGCLLVVVGVALHVVPPLLNPPKLTDAHQRSHRSSHHRPLHHSQAFSRPQRRRRRRIFKLCHCHCFTRVSQPSDSLRRILAISRLSGKGPIGNTSRGSLLAKSLRNSRSNTRSVRVASTSPSTPSIATNEK